ncbi:protein kinase-like domain, concanavalin A-like lectin/glucanase domain protein [Tanacetum coccineum]
MAEGEIDNLTMEQYLALTRGNQAPGVVKPEIEGNANFEIKSQFMWELREDTFSGNKNDDAHEHVERVIDIVSLFNIPGVSHDVVMIRFFPITLTGAAKTWVDRLPPGTIDSCDLLKTAVIQRHCPPSRTAKQLEEIRNFKQEGDETLYQAWKWYTDLLYKCLTHDIKNHQKVNIFYNGLGAMNRQLFDSQGPIPGMTPVQALKAIQTIADHLQKWHDGSSSRSIEGSSSEGIAAIVNKLENLGRDMKKLKENVHAIQVGCQTCEGAHLDKDCPLNEEVKGMEEVKYGEFSRPFPNNRYDGRFNKGGYDQPSSGEKRPSLTEIINKYIEEASKRQAEQDEWLKKFYQSTEASRETHDKIIQGLEAKVKTLANEVEGRANNKKFEECKTIYFENGLPLYTPFYYSPEEIEYFSANSGFSDNEEQETDDSGMAEAVAALEATLKKKREEPKKVKQNVNYYVDPYKPPIPFPKRLEHHAEEAMLHQTMKSLKKIKINRPLLKEIRQTDNYAKKMKYLVENKPRTEEDNEIRMNPRCFSLLQNHLPPKEQDPGSFILLCSIGKIDFKNALADLGASISIIPFSMYKRLGIGKLEPINMLIEMADNTKCTPKGIVKNLLIKIDKFIFPVDFVILDMVEDIRMPIILGRPLLATAHAQVDIFRKAISLEVGSEKMIFKMRSSFTTINFASVCLIKSETFIEDDNRKEIDYNLFLYDSESYEDDLEGILDYLKPRSYDGFIDLDDEAYNKRRCKLLGMTYEEPNPILIEKAKVTRYIIGPGETYTKVMVLGVEKIPRTRDNVAAMRAKLMKKWPKKEITKQRRRAS